MRKPKGLVDLLGKYCTIITVASNIKVDSPTGVAELFWGRLVSIDESTMVLETPGNSGTRTSIFFNQYVVGVLENESEALDA